MKTNEKTESTEPQDVRDLRLVNATLIKATADANAVSEELAKRTPQRDQQISDIALLREIDPEVIERQIADRAHREAKLEAARRICASSDDIARRLIPRVHLMTSGFTERIRKGHADNLAAARRWGQAKLAPLFSELRLRGVVDQLEVVQSEFRFQMAHPADVSDGCHHVVDTSEPSGSRIERYNLQSVLSAYERLRDSADAVERHAAELARILK